MRSNKTTYRPGTTQSITTSGTSAATSNAVSDNIYIVRIHATADCFIEFGKTPTATSSHLFMAAGAREYFQINPGEKVAAIQSTGAGVVYVTEMTS